MKAFDAILRRWNRSREGVLPLLEGTTVVWATYDIAEVSRHPHQPGALQLAYVDPDEGTSEDAASRIWHLGTTDNPKPGVYVWYVLQRDRKHGDGSVLVAYIGQSERLPTRISEHASGRSGTRGKRPPLATVLHPYADPSNGEYEVRLALVGDVLIDGRRWRPEMEDERLLVEAAMVVNGATVRAHDIINAAAAARTFRVED